MAVKWNVYESFQALLVAGPFHLALEGFLLLWIIWLLWKKPNSKHGIKLSKKEEEELLAEWKPEPLVSSPPDPSHPRLSLRTIKGKVGHFMDLGKGKKYLNLASHNYLNLNGNKSIENAAIECLHVYGVGSCGPRGFYGTTAVHLKLEERLREFYNCEMAILYSYGFSTIASAIPAYAKRGDIIFADECVNFAIQRGLQASRSRIVYFKHNSPEHLEELLEEQAYLDRKDPKKASATRRFLVVEGIYLNTGELCSLPEIVSLRQKYKLRLFIDDSVAFGTIGPHARGILDHFNIPKEEADLIMVSLEYSAATTGGFCVGTDFVIEHQRLSGLGYCFSASLPPLLAAAAIQVIDIFEAEGGELVTKLQHVCTDMHAALQKLPSQVCMKGHPLSPVKHMVLSQRLDSREEEEDILQRIVKEAEENGIALVLASYLVDKEVNCPEPSIRIAVNVALTPEEIREAAYVIGKLVEDIVPHSDHPCSPETVHMEKSDSGSENHSQ